MTTKKSHSIGTWRQQAGASEPNSDVLSFTTWRAINPSVTLTQRECLYQDRPTILYCEIVRGLHVRGRSNKGDYLQERSFYRSLREKSSGCRRKKGAGCPRKLKTEVLSDFPRLKEIEPRELLSRTFKLLRLATLSRFQSPLIRVRNRFAHSSAHFSPTPSVLGDNRPHSPSYCNSDAVYVYHLQGYKSSCPIDTEGASFSRHINIPFHSSRLRPKCVRGSPTQSMLFTGASFL
ncbi:hypothetical protein TNCV_2063781 [Trichonephila clavipes]|nr:hypothetical protein TNCV_2063781 [Trichonephila clavipes]